MAETSSLYSNTSASLRANFESSQEALALILISGFLKPWNTDIIIRTIGQKAYAYNYQGNWKRVQLILESYDFQEELDTQQAPEKLIATFLMFFSPEDFYGNIVPLAYKLAKYRIFFKNPFNENFRRPQRPVFRRGYKDKGSRRLPHERHGEPPYKEKEIDRRYLIKHPLADFVRRETSAEDDAKGFFSKTAPIGGENDG